MRTEFLQMWVATATLAFVAGCASGGEEEQPGTVAVTLAVDHGVTRPGLERLFIATATPSSTRPVSRYRFDFADGATSEETAANAPDGTFDGVARHAFTAAGEYTVTVTASDAGNATGSATVHVSVVPAANLPPELVSAPVYEMADTDPVLAISASVSDADVPDGDAVTTWAVGLDADGDGAIDATALLASGSFAVQPPDGMAWVSLDAEIATSALVAAGAVAPGTYRLLFEAHDLLGGRGTVAAQLQVYADEVRALLEAIDPASGEFTGGPIAIACGQLASFRHSGSAQRDPLRSLVRFGYDFGDGASGAATDAQAIVQHRFTTAGTRTVTLTATDDRARQGTDTLAVVVMDRAPVAVPGGPYTFAFGSGVTLDGRASYDPDLDCGDAVVRYDWDFNDDGVYDAIGGVLTLTPAQLTALGFIAPAASCAAPQASVSRTIRLRVTDAAGLHHEATTTLTGKVDQPFACPAASPTTLAASCASPQAITFDSAASFHGAAPERAIVKWEWDFTFDGTTFTPDVVLATPAPAQFGAFPLPGSYTAALRVTDDAVPPKSAIATVPVTVTMTNHAPVAVPSPSSDATSYFYAVTPGVPVTIDGTGSSDPDACLGDAIVVMEWDMNNDGVYDVRSSTPFTYLNPSWTPGTIQTIFLRVQDGYGARATKAAQLRVGN